STPGCCSRRRPLARAAATARRRPSRRPPSRPGPRSATRSTPDVPELPEVETVRAGLERTVVGRTIADVEVLGERTLRRYPPGAAEFAARLAGRRVLAARRRGKYLWLPLDDDAALLAHLGMSGQMLAADAADPPPAHLRARFRFTDGGPELRFADQRTFGGLALSDAGYTAD